MFDDTVAGSSTFRPGWSWRCLGSWHQSTESPRSPRRVDLGSMHLCQRRSKDHVSLSSFETWKQDVWTHIRSCGNGSRVIKTYEVPYLGEMNIHSRPILVSTRVPGFWPVPIFYSWPFSQGRREVSQLRVCLPPKCLPQSNAWLCDHWSDPAPARLLGPQGSGPGVMVPLSENHTCLKGYTTYSKSSFKKKKRYINTALATGAIIN